MNWKGLLGEAFPVIEQAAPLLASAIGSPAAGPVALFALNLIAGAFGVGPADIHTLSKVITGNENNADMLRKLQDHFGQYFPPEYLMKPTSAEINLKMNWDREQIPVDQGKIPD